MLCCDGKSKRTDVHLYGNLKLLTIVLTSNTNLREIGDEVIAKKLSYNILDKARWEQIPSQRFGKVIYV